MFEYLDFLWDQLFEDNNEQDSSYNYKEERARERYYERKENINKEK